MKPQTDVSLSTHNSFAINTQCQQLFQPQTVAQLQQIPVEICQHSYILGEGSNTLFIDPAVEAVINPCFKGVEVTKTSDAFYLTVAAGENWPQLVEYCIAQNMTGLENLALIPGSVGAAPVQNIGAYGAEFADYCQAVHWYDFNTQQVQILTYQQCLFAYRDSIFKGALKGKGLITAVELKLPKVWQANIGYHGLSCLAALAGKLTANTVMEQVISLRQQKLPDPEVLANAGSFFKNPVVDVETFARLLQHFPDMPNYPQANGQVKLAAGWLIETAGLKGYQDQMVGTHQQQALVLVNYGGAQGKDIVALAQYIHQQVYRRFGVALMPEVRFVGVAGEYSDAQLQQLFLAPTNDTAKIND